MHHLDLTAKADANMRALSGGMKRRVLVAQALVHRPPVIVLDEPTAGVDDELRQTLWHFVARLNREGHTVLLTTHYLDEAEALCGRIAMLKLGQVVALDRTPALTAVLYLMTFGHVLEGHVQVHGICYTSFLIPGLVMMSVLQNAFANSSSSLIQSKVTGNLVFVLLTPLSHWAWFAAYVGAAVVRGVVV